MSPSPIESWVSLLRDLLRDVPIFFQPPPPPRSPRRLCLSPVRGSFRRFMTRAVEREEPSSGLLVSRPEDLRRGISIKSICEAELVRERGREEERGERNDVFWLIIGINPVALTMMTLRSVSSLNAYYLKKRGMGNGITPFAGRFTISKKCSRLPDRAGPDQPKNKTKLKILQFVLPCRPTKERGGGGKT